MHTAQNVALEPAALRKPAQRNKGQWMQIGPEPVLTRRAVARPWHRLLCTAKNEATTWMPPLLMNALALLNLDNYRDGRY